MEDNIPQTYHEEGHPYDHDAPTESAYGPDAKRQLMGMVVLVEKVLHKHRHYKTGSCKWVVCSLPEDKKRPGWIVGHSYRQNGHFEERGPEWQGVWREWKVDETIPCILVKYWPTLQAIPIPENGFWPTSATPVSPARWEWQRFQAREPENARECREEMRKEAKKRKRDAKGRFI